LVWAYPPDSAERYEKRMLTKKKKDNIIAKYRTHESDTGSSQVQIAILTEEVKELTKHLKEHQHDYSSRRGLIKKVNERKKLLKYLFKDDQPEWEKLVKDLKIKVPKQQTEKQENIEDELPAPVEEEEEEVEEVKDDTV